MALSQSLRHLGIELEKFSKKGEILHVGKNCAVRGHSKLGGYFNFHNIITIEIDIHSHINIVHFLSSRLAQATGRWLIQDDSGWDNLLLYQVPFILQQPSQDLSSW